MAYERKLRRIALIDQPTLARCVSPELMLVDPELAERARELLREPHEGNGKGNMSALGTHEFTAGMSLGLEPPLSPPTVVRGPSAMMPEQTPHHDLPTPPPALRPPDGGMGPELSGPEPEPMPVVPDFPPLEPAAPQAQEPQQQEPQQPPQQPEPEQAEPLMAPPLQEIAPTPQPEPEVPALQAAPEPELPAMAPPLEPVQPAAPTEDYFAAELTPPAAPPPEPAEEAVEPMELQPVTLTPPPAPPVEAAPPVELPPPVEAPPAAELVPELPEIDLTPPVQEPKLAEPVPALEPAFFGQQHGVFKVVVRLKEGEGVEVGEFRDFGTAMEGAQEVIEEFSNANGSWPFYAGRFIRPDLIISVDVVDGSSR